jgi:outer membrane protein assembly factor BamB
LNPVEVRPANPCPAGTPATDQGRIFSSPAVVGDRILFSVDADGQNGHRGYMVAAKLKNGDPIWIRELDVDSTGAIVNDGCGNVWSSPTVVGDVEVVTVSDCDFKNTKLYEEKVIAVKIADGTVRWIFDPGRNDPDCDWDFGATVNYGTDAAGSPFLGAAGKDGTYYRIRPGNGTLVWRRNLVFGGFAGGFIGSTAFDGKRAYGATALGDFGRFEGFGSLGCMPIATNADGHPDLLIQEPSLHAVDAASGEVAWQGLLSQSFGPTTVAGDLVFIGTGTTAEIHIHDATTGIPLKVIPLPTNSLSGIIPAGDTIYFGIGSGEQMFPAGVIAMRPLLASVLDALPPLPIAGLPPLRLPEIPFPSLPLPVLPIPDLGVP